MPTVPPNLVNWLVMLPGVNEHQDLLAERDLIIQKLRTAGVLAKRAAVLRKEAEEKLANISTAVSMRWTETTIQRAVSELGASHGRVALSLPNVIAVRQRPAANSRKVSR